MSVRHDAQRNSYDVVVVGGGLGGLSAATLLARSGRRVLLVDRGDRPGGYAHAFKRGKYRFDPAVHMLAGGQPHAYGGGGLTHGLLTLLGVRDRCRFERVESFYTTIFPDLRLEVPTGPDFVETYLAHFPAEARGLRRLQRLSALVAREMQRVPADLPTDQLLAEDLALIHRYRDATVADVFDDHLRDPRLKASLASLWPYVGLPPSRAAFVTWAPILSAYIDLGVYHCMGGFQRLVDALVASLKEQGGEVLTRSAVRRIFVDRGRVSGIKLDNGQRIATPVVVSNVDPLQTWEELVGTEHVAPAYLAQMRALRPSLSAAVMFLATDMDLAAEGLTHTTFVYEDWDHDETYRRILAGEPSSLMVTAPTLVDPSLAPAGEHLLIVTALLPYNATASWRHSKPAYERALLEKLETVIPGIGQRTTFTEGATPRTLERYTLNLAGAVYGWELSPEQSGTRRLSPRTPVEGLYLAGHWTQPGGGTQWVLASGIKATELITGTPLLPAVFASSLSTSRTPWDTILTKPRRWTTAGHDAAASAGIAPTRPKGSER